MIQHSIHCRSYRGVGVQCEDKDCDCGATIFALMAEGNLLRAEVERRQAEIDKLSKTANRRPHACGYCGAAFATESAAWSNDKGVLLRRSPTTGLYQVVCVFYDRESLVELGKAIVDALKTEEASDDGG